MSQAIAEHPAPAGQIVRWTVSIHALVLLAQLVMAVLIVAGQFGLLAGHGDNAWVVLALGVSVALSALGLARSRLGPLFMSFALAIPAMEGLQIWLGLQQTMVAWHVTLGVLIWAFSLALLIKVWTPTWLAARPPTQA